jgi:hypothetical protein
MHSKVERQPRLKSSENNLKDSTNLKIVYRRIDTLKPDPANPRRHTKKQIRQIADSIAAFDFNVPILTDGEHNIVVGHGRFFACRLLGITEVPTLCLDHLTPEQGGARSIFGSPHSRSRPNATTTRHAGGLAVGGDGMLYVADTHTLFATPLAQAFDPGARFRQFPLGPGLIPLVGSPDGDIPGSKPMLSSGMIGLTMTSATVGLVISVACRWSGCGAADPPHPARRGTIDSTRQRHGDRQHGEARRDHGSGDLEAARGAGALAGDEEPLIAPRRIAVIGGGIGGLRQLPSA